jgi:hypothetical protein
MSQSSPQPDGCQDLAALGRASSECRSERPLAPPRWTNPFDRTGCSRYQHRFHILFGGIGLSSGLRMIPASVRIRIRIRSPLSWRKKRLSHPWTEGAAVHSRIVVGVDGSPASIRALKWALDQAALTGAAVEAINAWQYPRCSEARRPQSFSTFQPMPSRSSKMPWRASALPSNQLLRGPYSATQFKCWSTLQRVPISWLWVAAVTAASSECFSGLSADRFQPMPNVRR